MTRSARRSAASAVARTADGCAVLAAQLGQRRLPQGEGGRAAGRGVRGHLGHLKAGQAHRESAGSLAVADASRNVGRSRSGRRPGAAGAGSARRGSRRRRGSRGTRPRRHSAAAARTPTSGRGRATACGAACPGWSGRSWRVCGPSPFPRRGVAVEGGRAELGHSSPPRERSWSAASALVGAGRATVPPSKHRERAGTK